MKYAQVNDNLLFLTNLEPVKKKNFNKKKQ